VDASASTFQPRVRSPGLFGTTVSAFEVLDFSRVLAEIVRALCVEIRAGNYRRSPPRSLSPGSPRSEGLPMRRDVAVGVSNSPVTAAGYSRGATRGPGSRLQCPRPASRPDHSRSEFLIQSPISEKTRCLDAAEAGLTTGVRLTVDGGVTARPFDCPPTKRSGGRSRTGAPPVRGNFLRRRKRRWSFFSILNVGGGTYDTVPLVVSNLPPNDVSEKFSRKKSLFPPPAWRSRYPACLRQRPPAFSPPGRKSPGICRKRECRDHPGPVPGGGPVLQSLPPPV